MPKDWVPPPLPEVKIRELPNTMELPPLLKEVLKMEKGTDNIPPIPVKFKSGMNNRYKAKED